MDMSNSKEDFLNMVCKSVSFKEAHCSIKEELEIHIEALIEDYIEEGYEKEEASNLAVQSMGDPGEIGEQLNQVHSWCIQWQVVVAAIILSIVGVMTLFLMEGLPFGSGIISGKRQIVSMTVGILTIIIMYRMNYRHLIDKSGFLYFFGILLTTITVLFDIKINGFGFVEMGSFSFAPSMFNNIIFLISITGILIRLWEKGRAGLIKILAYMLSALICLYKTSDAGLLLMTAAVYLWIITSAVLKDHFIIKNKKTALMIIYGAVLGAVILLFTLSGSKMNVLADIWVNSQFPVMVSRFGLTYILIVMVLFVILISSMISSTVKMKNRSTLYLSSAIVVYLVAGCTLSLITSIVPLNGISANFSFISFGGSHYISDCILIGLFLSMWRRNNIVKGDIGKECPFPGIPDK